MDYKKTSILLKKIKSLHKTLADNTDQPHSMEQELMKSYLRDFYDSFVSGEGATDIFNEELQKDQLNPKTNASPIPIQLIKEDLNQVTSIETTKEVDPIQSQEPTHTANTTQTIVDTPVAAPIIDESTVVIDKEADSKTDEEMVVEGKEVIKQLVNDPVDADLLALFNESPVTDLSDKLALLPINDLTKALSINERFFTIQELFGGNSDLFQTTLKTLNSFSNFEEASENLMSNVASEYKWASTAKQKKATNFIKLVRRRYQ